MQHSMDTDTDEGVKIKKENDATFENQVLHETRQNVNYKNIEDLINPIHGQINTQTDEPLCLKNEPQSNFNNITNTQENFPNFIFPKQNLNNDLDPDIKIENEALNLTINHSHQFDNKTNEKDILENTNAFNNFEGTITPIIKENEDLPSEAKMDISKDNETTKLNIELQPNQKASESNDFVQLNNNIILPSNKDITTVENTIEVNNSKEELNTEKIIKIELESKENDLINTESKQLNNKNVIDSHSEDTNEKPLNENEQEEIGIKIEKQDCNVKDDETSNIEVNHNTAEDLVIKEEKNTETGTENELNIKEEYEEMNTESHLEDPTVGNDCPIKIVSVGSLKEEMQQEAIKQESIDDLTSYSYPNYDDSMDSNDAAAFCKVETCLQEEGRDEDFQGYDEQDHLYKVIKEEENLTVTDTHLISNKFTDGNCLNSYDMIHNDNSLMVEMNPMPGDFGMKPGNPEAILPTLDNYSHEMFQLNSITGDVISLEEEAYLLKAKSKKNRDKKHACPKCKAFYASASSLRKHLKLHNNGKNDVKFRKRNEKLKKQKKNDPSSPVKKKEPVKKPSPQVEEKQTPLKKRNSDYECVCGAVFSRKIRMETCMKSHNADANANRVQCPTCSKSFNSKEELEFHRKRVHRKRFPCKFCPTDHDTGKDLFEHLKIHRQVQLTEFKVMSELVQGEEILNCFMCTSAFKELSQLKIHVMKDHIEPYSCRYCKDSFPSILDFASHTKTVHPEIEGQSVLEVLEAFSKLVQAWKCEECDLQFLEADKLALHQAETHNPDLKTRPQIQCEDCRRVFMSQKGLQSHRRVHHSIETETAPPEETGVMCAECRKICKDMEALTSHMRLHSPDRKFPCKFCDFRFATAEKRRVHQEIHTGDMKYVCFICEYQCTSENRLTLHKRSAKHISMKQYLMSGAFLNEGKTEDKSEKEEKRVKKRKKERDRSSSSDSSDGSVLCDVCGDKFSSKNEMLEHKTSHPFIEFPNEDTPTRIFIL